MGKVVFSKTKGDTTVKVVEKVNDKLIDTIFFIKNDYLVIVNGVEKASYTNKKLAVEDAYDYLKY